MKVNIKSKFVLVLNELRHIKAMGNKYYYRLKSTAVTLAMVAQGKSACYTFMTSHSPIIFEILPAGLQLGLVTAS